MCIRDRYTGSHNNYGDSDFVWSQYSGYAGAVKGGLKMRNGGGTLGTGIMFRQTVRRYANTDLVSILTSTTPDSADFYISTTHNDSNTEKLRIKSSGEIGIGTSAPNARLTVNGNTVLGGATQISPLGGAGSVLVMADNDGTLYATSSSALLPPGSATLPPGISGQTLRHDGTVWTADSNLFNDGANVGIGTTIPRTRLSLGTAGENAASSKISVYENGNITYGIGLARGNTYGLGLYAASTMTGAPRVFVDASGNVGIGNTNPNYKLIVSESNSSRNTLRDVLALESTVSGPYINFGQGLVFRSRTYSNNEIHDKARIRTLASDHSTATTGISLIFEVATSSNSTVTSEVMRITHNGDVGIEMASSKDYSLFLLDINLGRGINGIEVLKIIREMPKYLTAPIIASTAYTMKGDKEKLLEAGFTDYISKPFSMDEIRKKVKEHINV